MSEEQPTENKSIEVNPPFTFTDRASDSVLDFSPKVKYPEQQAGDADPKDSSVQASVEYVL